MDSIINANNLIRTDYLHNQEEADHHPFQIKRDTPLLVQCPIRIRLNSKSENIVILHNFYLSRQSKSKDFDLNENI